MEWWRFLLLTAVLVSHAPAGADGTLRLFSERATVRAADLICGLLDRDERYALAAGYWQARGAALRSVGDMDAISRIDNQARSEARAMGCSSPSLVALANHLRHAFDAFSRTKWMEYPSTHRSWIAQRGVSQGWVTKQNTGNGAVFGLYRDGSGSEARLAGQSTAQRATSARLWLPEAGDLFGDDTELRALPRAMMRSYWASQQDGGVWIFPDHATKAFAELDPRSVAVVELQGSPVRRWAVEVGDYRAAAAFARIETQGGNGH